MGTKLRTSLSKLFGKSDEEHYRLALDLVEAGTDEDLKESIGKKLSKALPQGITSGMLYRDIVKIAWPAFVELTLTQLTSMADMMMVGRLGAYAISGVGLTNQPKFLLMTMFIAMNVGATALIARYKGAGEREKANKVLREALLLTYIRRAYGKVYGCSRWGDYGWNRP